MPIADIEFEQEYVTNLYKHLDGLRQYSKERLRKVLLETGGTPQARSERESFNAMYTEDIAKYDSAENGLCFGRIDLTDGENRYVGRVGILDEENDYETLLLDWRAPMARPFYLATTAAPDGVTMRRHIRSRSRKVTGVSDEFLDIDPRDSQPSDGAGGMASESALRIALNAARTGQMNDIVETIQSEQDRIIRSEHRSVLVVQGGPGTGKTAVALHRAAFLLYTYRQQLAKSGVLIIGPNDTFLDYIGQVLPSLGETGVLLSTIGDLYPGVRATLKDSANSTPIKGSLDMIQILKNAVRDRQELPTSPIRVSFDTFTVSLDQNVVRRARGRARSSRRPHNIARQIFVSGVVDALADQMVQILGQNVVDGGSLLSRDDVADIRDEIREDPEVAQAIEPFWPELSPQQVLTELLSSPVRLASAAPNLTTEQRSWILREDGPGFSQADAPLLDELAELLGVDDSAERGHEQKRWREQIADAQGALDILTGSAPQDLEDELDPEILMAYDLIDASQLAQRQEAGIRLTAAERAASDRTWTYGHVIVDEAQELSPMAWRMLMRRIPNRWMTVVGDTAQTGDPAGSSSWAEVLAPYVANRWKLHELTVNYRTPSEIMTVASDVLARIAPHQSMPRSIRDSGNQPWARRVDKNQIQASVTNAVSDVTELGLTAVIASHQSRDLFVDLESESVKVLSVSDAKGLEFDSVILVEPQQIVSESARGLNDLYVALTRATKRLGVIHTQDLPEVLDCLPQS